MDDLLQTLGLSRNNAPEDNAVCFALYPANCAGATEEDLDALRIDCMAAVLPHIERYVWQRDAFTLTSSLRSPPPWERPRPPGRRAAERQQQQEQHEQQQPPAPKRGPPCLWGAVAFGDSVDDEWFVAWLALELTRRFEGLAARVWDDDGEFLLIEAAYSLPRWLKPEVGAGRAWLLGGRLHVVPLPSARHPTLPASPSTAEALAIVRSEVVDTLAPRIEAPVLQRLSGYPAAARANTHTARALLPRRAAAVLKGEPQLIGPAVEAFYCRLPGAPLG
ncbi:putative Protein SGT1 [Monoraphidium neglectum]|uniref:Uncharacterized protein n=1 Tax=Monoraphidium neglectum TaxID=145388 RepID=A0A0D2IYG5_9CHLO|nr:putative Protein SGT1 [Monoraphidium neglectum]KIY92962.1 putative Protein SGT1 [Monoraphidium neglectum]|eukprot:XP_013891982.1 putative Protein SGT1 [Monoraphidium neglectum]